MHRFPKVPIVRHAVAMSNGLNEIRRKSQAHRELPGPSLRRAIREDAGLSQADVAGPLHVTRAAVSRWETGERRPRGDLLIAYSELLQTLRREGGE